jgi:hypothetical protein
MADASALLSPLQYCEFGGTAAKCEEWLETHHPDMHTKLYSDGTWSPLAGTALQLTRLQRC